MVSPHIRLNYSIDSSSITTSNYALNCIFSGSLIILIAYIRWSHLCFSYVTIYKTFTIYIRVKPIITDE